MLTLTPRFKAIAIEAVALVILWSPIKFTTTLFILEIFAWSMPLRPTEGFVPSTFSANLMEIISNPAVLQAQIFQLLTSAGQGHPGSLMSQVEILVALFYGNIMRWEKDNPTAHGRDKIIISKGHATMGLYPIFSDLGYFDSTELERFGTFDGMLRIFGNISIPGIDATTVG